MKKIIHKKIPFTIDWNNILQISNYKIINIILKSLIIWEDKMKKKNRLKIIKISFKISFQVFQEMKHLLSLNKNMKYLQKLYKHSPNIQMNILKDVLNIFGEKLGNMWVN